MLAFDLDGEGAGDRSGHSVTLSSDGSRVAIGSVAYDNVATTVRVYDWDATQDDWSPVPAGDGVAILNTSVRCGHSLAMSDDGSVISASTCAPSHALAAAASAAARGSAGFGGDIAFVQWEISPVLEMSI